MSAQPFAADNTAILLIDHQMGTMGWVRSIPFEQMKANALALAQTAKAVGIPLVLTSSMEEYAQGPLLTELQPRMSSPSGSRANTGPDGSSATV
ncbi:hypothetical protein AB0K24_43615, partial [Streptomyces mirabilis]